MRLQHAVFATRSTLRSYFARRTTTLFVPTQRTAESSFYHLDGAEGFEFLTTTVDVRVTTLE